MKQNHIFILAFLILILLGAVGCQSEPDISMLTPSFSPTSTPTTTTITQTLTITPTRTSKPTKTFTLTPVPTLNPKVFDASSILTVTPAAPAQCPTSNMVIDLDMDALIEYYAFEGKDRYPTSLNTEILLSYLNQGVSIDTIFNQLRSDELNQKILEDYQMIDVTGDLQDDLIFIDNFNVNILTCSENQYRHIIIGEGDMTFGAYVFDILDVNKDGLNDIVIDFSGCLGGSCPRTYIYSWNGSYLVDITEVNCTTTGIGSFSRKLKDTDNNGTLELVLSHRAENEQTPYFFTPFSDRNYSVICMWNGGQYVKSDYSISEPVYRMQAFDDAEDRFLFNQYDQAVELYLRVIHDQTLKRYVIDTQAKEMAWYGVLDSLSRNYPDTINDPMFSEDIKQDIYEYSLLASASYYRMLLIYLQQGDIKNAETMLVILKDAYGPGKTGEHFTKMAEIVLDNFKTTGSMEQSCSETISYTTDHWGEISTAVTFLQLDYFYLNPQHWCPFPPENYGEQ